MCKFVFMAAIALAVCAGCSDSRSLTETGRNSPSQKSNQVFEVKGLIKEIGVGGTNVVIRHEEVPNYMPAMTMPFRPKDLKELDGLKAGDTIAFRMTVTADDAWIDQIRKTELPRAEKANQSVAAGTNELPTTGPFRFVRDVEPLEIGDKLPEYHFTNQLGQAVALSQFKGQALAITFIFTRCPLPNFCPRMSSNFAEVQRKLEASSNGPTNWHLLTISFDPEFDSPAILKGYASLYKADPAHWSFLTGDITETSAISDQFGQRFWREEGAINHNLRTAVIDAKGRVQQIFQGNNWTPDDLVAELKKAAEAK